HHFLPCLRRLEDKSDNAMYKSISTYEQLLIYKYLIEDDLRQPAWAYANIGLAMIPGCILVPCFLWEMNVKLWFIVIIAVCWVGTMAIMFEQFRYTTDELLN